MHCFPANHREAFRDLNPSKANMSHTQTCYFDPYNTFRLPSISKIIKNISFY
uniref:Uncharacterized protein n=1 Tax=Rhizophora mucronata TaxID=61149 RepID=A0A2P2N4N4_RHIMU